MIYWHQCMCCQPIQISYLNLKAVLALPKTIPVCPDTEKYRFHLNCLEHSICISLTTGYYVVWGLLAKKFPATWKKRSFSYLHGKIFWLYSGQAQVHVKVTLRESKVSDLEDGLEPNANPHSLGRLTRTGNRVTSSSHGYPENSRNPPQQPISTNTNFTAQQFHQYKFY